jgi:ATP-dependent helicase/nuclease subunit B
MPPTLFVAVRQAAPMIVFDFAAASSPGSTIVTPNNRLARDLVARFDVAQVAAGNRAWAAMRAVPWHAWLRSLWLDALAAGAVQEPRTLISDDAAAHLWDRVVAQESAPLLDAHGAATLAADAWTLFHAWRRPDDRYEGWSHAGIGDDAAAFARWARRYAAALLEKGQVDSAQLADRLASGAPHVPAWRKRRIVTLGFIEFTPQQHRLLDAMRSAGVEFIASALPRAAAAQRQRVACPTPEAEVGYALAWARDRALAEPQAAIGIVVLDLATRRDEIAARAEDVLCPALASRVLPDAPRPYDLSLGIPLSDVPVVATAIDLLALLAGPIAVPAAAALLRSAHLPGAEALWSRRATAERQWREEGLRSLAFAEVVHSLDATDPALAAMWRAISPPGRGARSPAQWANDWRAWLDALGWPGDRPLGSGEWQACEAWSRLLATFATLASVSPMLARDEALSALRALSARAVFQPEAPNARIRIMGMLEASGLVFDALWIAGLTAEQWPPARQPHPLLPLAWQRERHVPHADPAADLVHARALTEGFAGAARHVVVSHGRHADGFDRAGSALLAAWPECAIATLPSPAGLAQEIVAAAGDLETCADDRAPVLPEGSPARGGVGIVESQSACPFQAFARYRLRADPWPDTSEGLTPQERGALLHAALAAFWNDVGDHATLVSLADAELGIRIAHAVTHARAQLHRRRWQALPAAVASGESQRLAETARAWLDAIERGRPPFAVRATEMTVPLALGGIGMALRIDRVDTIAAGGVAVIDYKSGRAVAPGQWFAPRPSGTQVGMYVLALRAAPDPPLVRAAVYAQLKAGEIGVQGLVADAGDWPPLKTAAELRGFPGAHWTEVEAAWARALGGLAGDFAHGAAAVAPRDAQCCRYCDLHALCRIQSLADTPERVEGNGRDGRSDG